MEVTRENTLFSWTSTASSPGEVDSLKYANMSPQLFLCWKGDSK